MPRKRLVRPDGVTGGSLGSDLIPGELRLQAIHPEGECVLAVAGELDLATAPELEAMVVQLCAHGAEELVIDLRGLVFMDAAGLRALIASEQLCEGHGCAFFLTRGRKAVERLFELSGLADSLPFRNLPPQNGHSSRDSNVPS